MEITGRFILIFNRFYDIKTTHYLIILKAVFTKNCDVCPMEDQEELRIKLAEYKSEHELLNDTIDRLLSSDQPVNLFQMQQLKKKKLWFKDMIQKIESSLIDDIIA
jgi:hypothetical protein